MKSIVDELKSVVGDMDYRPGFIKVQDVANAYRGHELESVVVQLIKDYVRQQKRLTQVSEDETTYAFEQAKQRFEATVSKLVPYLRQAGFRVPEYDEKNLFGWAFHWVKE